MSGRLLSAMGEFAAAAVCAALVGGACWASYNLGANDARSECHEASLAGELAAEKRVNADLTAQIQHQAASVHETTALKRAIAAQNSALDARIAAVPLKGGCDMPPQAVELLNAARAE